VKIHYGHFKHYFHKNIFPILSRLGNKIFFFFNFSNKFSINYRTENLTEQLITSLRKGNESEGKLTAIVASLFLIQLGEPDDELFIKFRDAILPILRDETKSSSIRKSVC